MEPLVKTYTLNSGRHCLLIKPNFVIAKGYHVLSFPDHQGYPDVAEQDEMLAISLKCAREISRKRFNHTEKFMLIHNGIGSRRRKNFHCHVIPVAGKVNKAAVYFSLFTKNVFHFIWFLTRGMRKALIHEPTL